MKSLHKKKLEKLQRQFPKGVLRLDEQTLMSHSGDKWFASNPPEAVAFPKNAKTVSEILRYANKNNIPLTARGACASRC